MVWAAGVQPGSAPERRYDVATHHRHAPAAADSRMDPRTDVQDRDALSAQGMPNFNGARSAWLESMDVLFEEMDAASIRFGVVMGRAASASGQLGGVGNSAIVRRSRAGRSASSDSSA